MKLKIDFEKRKAGALASEGWDIPNELMPLISAYAWKPKKGDAVMDFIAELSECETECEFTCDDANVKCMAAVGKGQGVVLIANLSKSSVPLKMEGNGIVRVEEKARAVTISVPHGKPYAGKLHVRFDEGAGRTRRGASRSTLLRDCSRWIARQNGFQTAAVPESAFDPLYSTWYAYLQDVDDKELEEEARHAASLGMKTMILDDGWQKEDGATFYSAVGDWMPVASRFPDMKAHVAAVHAAGLKYMLWLSVPYVGDESKAWARFRGKMLKVLGEKTPGRVGILDPRFPDVREYLISTYERVVGEWGFDGVKLDFINQFALNGPDPAQEVDYVGRDFRSVPEAVNQLMKDVLARLKRINPEVLIEFRQHYMGPAILQYGNMMRCSDCPADPCANRRFICDLRLASDALAVHSDMLVWNKDESAEGAALPILNALFATVQYSMILAKINPTHKEVIRHWLKFSQDHRAALLKGGFLPHHAENGYTWIESWSDKERILAAYAGNQVLPVPADGRAVYVINATQETSLVLDLAETSATAEAFDTFGKSVGVRRLLKGLNRVAMPPSGYLRLDQRVN